uniref:HAMP domain-containing histidine kinase n=1 Tax=Oscillatoriales cyanobacterium SpSt-402 TaxID=2282168 RepID=A0A832H458_9CYAN
MSKQCAPSQVSSYIQQMQLENGELRRYLEAQKKVIGSLERRVGRSLESLGVYLDKLSASASSNLEWQGSVEFVQNEVSSLSDLLSDAMLLQKLEAGKVEVNLEPLLVAPLLSAVSRHLSDVKADKPLRLICEFDSSLPPIWASQELLEAVLTDLLARSLRYSDSDSPVVLGAKAVGVQVFIDITAQRFAPVGNLDFATEIVLCCRRVEVQRGKVTCQQRPDGLQTVTLTFDVAS